MNTRAMDCSAEEMWENVRSHRVQIVRELRVDRSVLFDHLRSKAVFDNEDCQIVHAEKTNERKASKLLDILETKGKEGLEHFLDVLQRLNPGLYEKLTGQKATTNVISERDVEIQNSHLNRAVMDPRDMTLGPDHLSKENQQLKKRLGELETELDFKSKSLQRLRVQAMKAEEQAKEACNNARQIEKLADFHMKECTKCMNERHAYIFALLMKLWSSEEEAKELKKQVEEEKKRNEELLNKLKELSQSFDQERSGQSLKLSETTALQQSSFRTVEDLTNRYRELQFYLEKLQMERDQAICELSQVKSWAEALKARYDMVEKNKQQCQESYENVVVDCSLFRKQMQELQFQLTDSRRKEEYLQAQNAKLTTLVKKCQEQRDFYGEERRNAINEREAARKERDDITRRYSSVLKEKDEAVRNFLHEARESERQHELDTAEIRLLRERLGRIEEELKFLKIERELSSTMNSSTLVRESGGQGCKDDLIGEYSSEKPSCCNSVHSDQDVAGSKGQRSRTSSELIKSIKRRFQQTAQGSPPFEISGMDFQFPVAQWLPRLPCEVLAAMAYSPSGKSPVDQLIPISNVFNFGVPLSVSAECYPQTKQPVEVDSCVQWKNEKEILDKCYVIDDSITPEPRARAYDLDRSRTSRYQFRALRRIP